ncbi:MAG: response regulator [Pseudomonadota bacterium]
MRSKPCVLLVDDDEFSRELTELILGNAGCEVAMAEDGALGLAALKAGRYDLVFMDCKMPVMDGYEATRQYRQHEADLKLAHLPIIGLTGSAGPEYVARCLQAGMDDVLAKPYTAPGLADKLAQWLGRAPAQA